MIPPSVSGEKYRDKEAIKHSVIGWDGEMSMCNSSHQEDQDGDEVLDGSDGEDMCNQEMKQFNEEGSTYYLNFETVQSTSIQGVPSRLRQGDRLGNLNLCWDVGVVIVANKF